MIGSFFISFWYVGDFPPSDTKSSLMILLSLLLSVKSGFLAELADFNEMFNFPLKTELVIESPDLSCNFWGVCSDNTLPGS